MKRIDIFNKMMIGVVAIIMATSCNDKLDEPLENTVITGQTDYTKTENMISPLLGAYQKFGFNEWETGLLLSVRGDDVNAGGFGDQRPFWDTDMYTYDRNYWMYNSVWKNLYGDVLVMHSTMEEIEKYKEFASNPALADQYIAEVKVMRAYQLLMLSRTWGDIFITTSSDPADLLVATVSTKDEVMKHIVAQMDEAIPLLPDKRPNERTDVPGGITKYTALAVQAMANLELKNYQGVATATSQIISSNKFSLKSDFYQLFKIPGKLDNENLLEFQASDFGQPSGTNISHLFATYGPGAWFPAVANAGGGWGFYEPSLKYIKFMLDRGETVRLETSVIFTPRGIAEIKKDAKYTTLPAWINNVQNYVASDGLTYTVWINSDGDRFKDFEREMFLSGKHYLPSKQLTTGRQDYGSNKNFIVIRYAEILLMHAEALTRGATGTGMTADQAVNAVRTRAGLPSLTGVTTAQVMDEKYAELAMEWGTRFYDMVRTENIAALSYDGRTFAANKIFLPYPQEQVDLIPNLGK
jgi:starch-binding outer membrane protein, SusD/RagB family